MASSRTRARPVVVATIAAAAWCAAPASARAQEIRVRPVARDGHVYVSFSISDAFTADVREAIDAGLRTSFTYEVDLQRGGPLWFDRTIASTIVTASVRYDNLTRKYHVTRTHDGRVERSDLLADEEGVRAWLTSFDRLRLFTTERLEANGEYALRVRARTSPGRAWAPWPWGRDDASGLAKFTFLP